MLLQGKLIWFVFVWVCVAVYRYPLFAPVFALAIVAKGLSDNELLKSLASIAIWWPLAWAIGRHYASKASRSH